MNLEVIGRTMKLSFPEIDLDKISAKVDTGAYTSSIHCGSIEKIGEKQVRCIFLDADSRGYSGKSYTFDIVKEVNVKSSNGIKERRIVIQTKVVVNEKEFDIYLTLTDRKDMKFPVLLGRKFLKNRFLVDVSISI